MMQQLLPDLPGFSIEQTTIAHGVITVLARSQTISGQCPECAHLSSRIHSRYQRTFADLPGADAPVLATWDIRAKMERRNWLYPFVFFAISPMKKWRYLSLQRFLA